MGLMSFFKRTTRPAPAMPRRYAAADITARYADFRKSSGSADYELRNSLTAVRNKARSLARDSSSMKRYLTLMKTNINGPHGFRLQSRVRKNDGRLNTTLNAAVESAWASWCENPTTEGETTFVDVCNQMIETWCRDGEVLIEIVYGREYTDGIALNLLESDMLDETLNTTNPTTKNEIRMGVEIGANGRRVAYHLLTQHPGDLVWYSGDTDRRYRRVPANTIIHVFERLRPGQTRGEPPAAPIVNSIKMLDGYREAETMGRRLRAALMGFFTKTLPAAEQITEIADRVADDEIFEMDMEPGRLRSLPTGYEFQQFDPGGSQTDYKDFEGQVKKDVSMGLGISTMSHGMEVEGVSYSSGRTVTIEDRDYYQVMQQFFIRNAARRIFKLWVSRHALRVDAAFLPSQTARVIENFIFRPRGWDWVDPAKDVKANTEALRTKQTSLSRVAAQRGIDRDELLAEIADDEMAATEAGLTLDYSDGKSDPTQDVVNSDDLTP